MFIICYFNYSSMDLVCCFYVILKSLFFDAVMMQVVCPVAIIFLIVHTSGVSGIKLTSCLHYFLGIVLDRILQQTKSKSSFPD